MTPSTESAVAKFLKSKAIPGTDRLLGELGKVVVEPGADEVLVARIELGLPVAGIEPTIRRELGDALCAAFPDQRVRIECRANIRARGVQRNLKPLDGVRNIVAVASGKGGVGKSTVAANLALALAADGARVGILDADIYGPSQPQMMGIAGESPESPDGKNMRPLAAFGLQIMSIGFLIEPDRPMVWRGPMVTSALNQLLHQTLWDDLDYLVVDMPPGTGDIQLTLSQQVPVAGAVIVTTPQDIAAIDARKGLAMFRKVSIPVLGVVENMSSYVCGHCGQREPLFGAGGAAAMCADFDVPLLGEIPLVARIRETTDGGAPTVAADPDSAEAAAFVAAARRMAAELAARDRDYSKRFPDIVVEAGS